MIEVTLQEFEHLLAPTLWHSSRYPAGVHDYESLVPLTAK
jgi:hypothetical protein